MKHKAGLFVLCLAIALTSGCSLFGKAESLVDKSVARVGLGPNAVTSVGVMAELSNTPSAVMVDIAFAYGDAASTVLSKSNATTWFQEYEGFCENYSNQLDVIRIELPMGYSALLSQLPKDHLIAQSIFVFVRNVGKGNITKLETPWVNITKGKLKVLPAPPGSKTSGKALDAVKGARTLC